MKSERLSNIERISCVVSFDRGPPADENVDKRGGEDVVDADAILFLEFEFVVDAFCCTDMESIEPKRL